MKRASYLESLKTRNPDLYIKLMIRKGVNAELKSMWRLQAAVEEQIQIMRELVEESSKKTTSQEQDLKFLKALFSLSLLTLK